MSGTWHYYLFWAMLTFEISYFAKLCNIFLNKSLQGMAPPTCLSWGFSWVLSFELSLQSSLSLEFSLWMKSRWVFNTSWSSVADGQWKFFNSSNWGLRKLGFKFLTWCHKTLSNQTISGSVCLGHFEWWNGQNLDEDPIIFPVLSLVNLWWHCPLIGQHLYS